ncbi:FMN-binding glutamate synthase family protein [Polynucleobacter sp. MG-5-Ahmo-C2]|jgi:glutamate synthase domain-containing protein 2|uniref:FMN-binding glutamate synthase family protein n=1 Tax=unclassified Polynucleobacter TaxID=2640945 RepID=UPI001BFEDBF2|nr:MULTISPECIES: FMN-binding glutamate synthase family protein [unclassified Polynucleobacter]QWD71829.1 FMN-binding glutamate synthase family protein [Polynucleobacter sp. UB-Raua-W9]QWD97909.1 FMN-binding glutamate synthase family protein [Polynucleobacter sp. MG-5-Ahmo-C2]
MSPILPIRLSTFAICVAGTIISAVGLFINPVAWYPLAIFGLLTILGIHDRLQTRHAVLRNYPILGHMRFLLEFIRPEIRQYFIEGDNDKTPFSRSQRTLVYSRSKAVSDKRPFGTTLDVMAPGYQWINQSLAPTHLSNYDFRIEIGSKDCTQKYSASIFNISAMSFGALSANAVMALNLGAKKGNFAHDTGEGSISRYHRLHGGDLIWEIGSGYFGCRTEDGQFDPKKFAENALKPQVKMIEIKLSQGAKPGHGGILPGPKVTIEIAEARGVKVGEACVSPSSHSAFSTPLEMMAFIQQLRELSGGKPVGFKLCIGHPWEWFAIVKAMLKTKIYPDFIVVDGTEGGTGASPVEFSNHVGTPLQEGLRLVHNSLVGVNLREQIKIGCSGKIISAFDMAVAFALGADWCNSARGFMFSVGCIQAQVCDTGFCPTGVTTQDPDRQKALVVTDKSERVYQFHKETLKALKEIVEAAGLQHPVEINTRHIMRRVSANEVRLLEDLLPDIPAGSLLSEEEGSTLPKVYELYWDVAQAESFAAKPH